MELTLQETPRINRVAAIENLRRKANATGLRWTVKTIRNVVVGLESSKSLSDIAGITQLTEDEVLDVTAGLGTWLTHVHGKATNTVTTPPGFGRRSGHRRDVARSIVSIIAHTPSDEEIARWLDRKYPTDAGVLIGRDLYYMWLAARAGRLGELDLITDSAAFAQVTVAAFDLYDVTIANAAEGLSVLRHYGLGDDELDLDAIGQAATKVAWLDEGRIRRTLSLLEQAREYDNSVAHEALRRDLRALSYESELPQWHPSSIAALTKGQCKLLVERAGLGLPENIRRTEAEIRSKLIEKGLRSDLDRLLPDAMRSVQADLEDLFWDAIEARQAGDSEWRRDLEDAFRAYALQGAADESPAPVLKTVRTSHKAKSTPVG